jgi:hypothetical protein
MVQTDQKFPSVSSQTKGLLVNTDGSVDVYFGPKPPAGKENNWVQTIPGKGWLIDSSSLWAAGTLVQQDLATWRDRATGLSFSDNKLEAPALSRDFCLVRIAFLSPFWHFGDIG